MKAVSRLSGDKLAEIVARVESRIIEFEMRALSKKLLWESLQRLAIERKLAALKIMPGDVCKLDSRTLKYAGYSVKFAEGTRLYFWDNDKPNTFREDALARLQKSPPD